MVGVSAGDFDVDAVGGAVGGTVGDDAGVVATVHSRLGDAGMGGGKTVEDLFAAGRVLNGKVNASCRNLSAFFADMQQVQRSCDDHGCHD